MANKLETSIETGTGLEILQPYASIVYLEDLSDNKTFKNLKSVSVENNQLVLDDELTLDKGDIVRVDTGDFQGVYIVTKYDTGSHTVTVDSIDKTFSDVTYSANNPKVYKVTGIRNGKVITSINIPGSTRSKIDITSIEDRETRTVNGKEEIDEINVDIFYDPHQELSMNLFKYYYESSTFALWFRTKTDNIDLLELCVCQVNKIGGRDIKPGEVQKQTLTLNVNGALRRADLKAGV